MNTTQDRPTIPVPAASLSDAALMADYRSRKSYFVRISRAPHVGQGRTTVVDVPCADYPAAVAAFESVDVEDAAYFMVFVSIHETCNGIGFCDRVVAAK